MNMSIAFAVTALQLAAEYGANAKLDFSVVDEAGKPVAAARIVESALCTKANPPLDLVTDEKGRATYRGLLFRDVTVDVSSPDVYAVPGRRMEFSALTADGRTWATNALPPIVVRRKVSPHKMGVQKMFLTDLPDGVASNEFFSVSFGDYRGCEANGRTKTMCVIEVRPHRPEDGFAIVDLFNDMLGAPLVAPKDGYKSAPVYYIDENGARDAPDQPCRAFSFDPHRLTASRNGTALVFRHKVEKGFVYGFVKVSSAPRGGVRCSSLPRQLYAKCSYPSGLRFGWGGYPRCLDVWFNREAENLSLEPEAAE